MRKPFFLKLRSFFNLILATFFIFILPSCSAFQRELPEEHKESAPKKYKDIYKIKIPKQHKAPEENKKESNSKVEQIAVVPPQDKLLLTPGETFIYTLGWTLFSVGTAEVVVKPQAMVNETPSYHVHVLGKTNETFSSIYNAEMNIDLFLNVNNLKPYKLELSSRESRYVRNHVTLFDYVHKKASYWSKSVKFGRKKKEKLGEAEYNMMDNLFDALSPAFQVRRWALLPGKKIEFHVLENEKVYKIQCEVVKKDKREVLQTMEDAFYVECLGKTFKTKQWEEKDKKENHLWAWISADPRHYLIEAGAKVTIGSVTLKLTDMGKRL